MKYLYLIFASLFVASCSDNLPEEVSEVKDVVNEVNPLIEVENIKNDIENEVKNTTWDILDLWAKEEIKEDKEEEKADSYTKWS